MGLVTIMTTAGSASATSATSPISAEVLQEIQQVIPGLPWHPDMELETVGFGHALSALVLSKIETTNIRRYFDFIVSAMCSGEIKYVGEDEKNIKKRFEHIERRRDTKVSTVVLAELAKKDATTDKKQFVAKALEAAKDLGKR